MVLDFLEPVYATWHSKLLALHITLGLNGWFALMIIGFSYKLVPMFSLSHNYETKLPNYSLWFINGGIILTIYSILLEFVLLQALGWIIVGIGYVLYMVQI